MGTVVELKYSNINNYISKLNEIDDKLELAYKQLAESTDFGSLAMQATWSFGSKKAIFNELAEDKKLIKKMREANRDLMTLINDLDDNYEKVSKKSKNEIDLDRILNFVPGWLDMRTIIPKIIVFPFTGIWGAFKTASILHDIIAPVINPAFTDGDIVDAPELNNFTPAIGNDTVENNNSEPAAKTDYLTAEEFAELKRQLDKYANSQYVFGGSSVDGIDCSGLVMNAYRDAGICNFSHKTQSIYDACTPVKNFSKNNVSLDGIYPGDIICFSNGGPEDISHVAVYIGDGKIMHALNPDEDVKITAINYTNKANIYVCRPKREKQ